MMNMKEAGMVLEGGGTRGVFTSGVLDYLMEQEVYFPYVIGVSAGSCNAVDYVSRQPYRTKDCMIPEGKENSYFNLRNAVKTHSLFDMEMVFDRYPNEIYPFDYDTYFQSDMQCELVVTNCSTGKAEYLKETADRQRLMDICRASSSIPLASPMVKLGSHYYLDGGIADSIPIIRSLKTGHKKNVIVLTRNKGYRKKPIQKSKKFYVAAYSKYPNLIRSICNRAIIYNKTLTYIEKWEREGKVFVIRPQVPVVSRTETNQENLTAFYQHGYDEMKAQFEKMMEFMHK